MIRTAISPRLEGTIKKDEKIEKRNISDIEYQKQAAYIKASVSNFKYNNWTVYDFLQLFCNVCQDYSITSFDINKLINLIKNCFKNGEFSNLLTFTKDYNFEFKLLDWISKNLTIDNNIAYINKIYFDSDFNQEIDYYKNEMNYFVQLFNSLNKEQNNLKLKRFI